MASTWPITSGNFPVLAYAGPPSVTEVTLALDSAYTYASGGDAVFWCFQAQESGTLTDFWVKVSSYTGTWGSTDGVIDVQIREGINGTAIPGTTLTGSFTVTLDGTTTGWIKKSSLSISLTAGTVYCVVIGDADGGASNYVTIVHRTSTGAFLASNVAQPYNNGTTTSTNGFSSAGTLTNGAPVSLVKVDALYYGGGAFSSVATSASNTNEKGIRFKPSEDCTFAGWVFSQSGTNVFWSASRDFKLYADATSPGGTTLVTATGTDISSGATPLPFAFVLPASSRVDLTAGTWYRAVMDPGTNSTAPSKVTAGGSPDADVLAAMMPLGSAHYIEESGGAWDDTQTTVLATLGPLLIPKTASASGGGAAMLLNSGALVG